MQHERPHDPGRPIVHPVSQSTGPRTTEGKATSSRNATKHGCCADSTLILANESIEDYKALEATWFMAYRPKDEGECRLVQQLVNADWFLERANRTVAEVEAQIFECGYLPLNWSDEQHNKLARFTRYQTARANAVLKARKAVEDYRKNRVNEVIKSEKHQAFKEKVTPEPSVREIFDSMAREKARQDQIPR
jgi:hypothetical protein